MGSAFAWPANPSAQLARAAGVLPIAVKVVAEKPDLKISASALKIYITLCISGAGHAGRKVGKQPCHSAASVRR